MNTPAQAAPIPPPPVHTAAASPGQPTQASVRASNTANAATAAIARADAIAAARPAPAAPAEPPTRPAAPVVTQASTVPLPTAPAPVATTVVHPWRTFFSEWPSQIPKRGILITRLNDASPFKAFMMRGDFLLIERTSPDSLGGRFLVIPFDEISTVKFTDPLKQPALEAAGFEGQLSL